MEWCVPPGCGMNQVQTWPPRGYESKSRAGLEIGPGRTDGLTRGGYPGLFHTGHIKSGT